MGNIPTTFIQLTVAGSKIYTEIRKGGYIFYSCQNDKLKTQTHVLICEGYDKLREGLNLAKQGGFIKY